MLFYVSKKISLARMVSRENNAHCSGGILADDQVISCFRPFSQYILIVCQIPLL